MTLRSRLAVSAAVLIAVLGLVGYLLIRTVENSQLQQVDRDLTGRLPAALILNNGQFTPPPQVRAQASAGLIDFYIARIVGNQRIEWVAPTNTHGQAPRLPASGSPTVRGVPRPVTVGSVSGDQRWRAILLQEPHSTDKVLVALSLAHVDATVSRLRLAVTAAGGLVLLVLAACGFWLIRLGLRPIVQVTQVADAIALGQRSRRLSLGGSRTEAAHLARAFNIMLDEQQTSEDRLRDFVANASHELRTPVSAIRGFAELWRHGHLRQGPALDDAMRRIGQESARMAALVEDLLLLARLDEGRPISQADVDLRSLVHDAVLDASATHPSRQISVDATESVRVTGDEAALRQVIANLVTNALTHTPTRAAINVHVTADDRSAVLEVHDSGPGMSPHDAARAFDRFWRGDASRTRPGTGLGLPIVEAIVNAHNGRLNMNTSPDAGTLVRIELPTAHQDNNSSSIRSDSSIPTTCRTDSG